MQLKCDAYMVWCILWSFQNGGLGDIKSMILFLYEVGNKRNISYSNFWAFPLELYSVYYNWQDLQFVWHKLVIGNMMILHATLSFIIQFGF
jgi:hypothetical protein